MCVMSFQLLFLTVMVLGGVLYRHGTRLETARVRRE